MNELQKQRLYEITEELDHGRFSLTKWECDFLENILKRLDNNDYLSPKQIETLENIARKYLRQ